MTIAAEVTAQPSAPSVLTVVPRKSSFHRGSPCKNCGTLSTTGFGKYNPPEAETGRRAIQSASHHTVVMSRTRMSVTKTSRKVLMGASHSRIFQKDENPIPSGLHLFPRLPDCG